MNLFVTLAVWFGFAALFVGGLFFLYWIGGQNVLHGVAVWYNTINAQVPGDKVTECPVFTGHVVCFSPDGKRIESIDGKRP